MLSSVVARLLDRAPVLVDVQVAEDLQLLADGIATAADSGTGFVIPYRDRAGENSRSTGGHLQKVGTQFLTAFVVRHLDDARGAERASMFDAYKAAIETALAGWEPDDVSDPCELVGGEGTYLGNGVSIYVQTWETARFLTGE